MKDLIDILCWFINLFRGLFEILGLDTNVIDDLTGKLLAMGE